MTCVMWNVQEKNWENTNNKRIVFWLIKLAQGSNNNYILTEFQLSFIKTRDRIGSVIPSRRSGLSSSAERRYEQTGLGVVIVMRN